MSGYRSGHLRNIRDAAVSAATLLAAALGCCSCKVGPNYQRPPQPMPNSYGSATTQPATTQPALTADWWRLFDDETLNRLENDAIANNPDLFAAMARVEQSRAAAKQVRADFFPTITFDPSIQRSRAGQGRVTSGGLTVINSGGATGTDTGAGSTGGTVTTSGQSSSSSSGSTVTSVRIPFDFSYEVDIWGRIRRNYEAAQAQVAASAADYHLVLQTLQADVAQDYFAIRAFADQEQILAATVESYRQQLELVQKQVRVGLIGQTDLAQAQAQLDATITQQLEARRQRADLEHALAILIGRPPGDLRLDAKPQDKSPPPLIPPSMPAALLRNRPDVVEAEQNLVAANAQIGVAQSLFYPQLDLSSTLGFESFDVRHALDWENRVWSIGAGLTQPIFEGGRLTANLQQARARYDELNAAYRSTVLGAIRDVEDALTDLHYRADEAIAQDRAVKSSREYVRLSELQYRQGLTSYLLVIDAQRTLLSNELTASQILNQRRASTVLLIKALGGGWDPQLAEVSSTTRPASEQRGVGASFGRSLSP